MKVRIYDWHFDSQEKLKELGLFHNMLTEMSIDSIFELTKHFRSVILRQFEDGILLVAVSKHNGLGAR